MEEFSALAARVAASVGDLRGVLILSRDGLVLGAFPDGDEALVKPAWLRFAGLGESDKGFVEFGDEVWAYVRRGPYAAFTVTGPNVRPGLVMDQLEQMLMAAEEQRARREALRLPDVAPAPSGKPRTSLHAEPRQVPQPAQAPGQPVAPARPVAAPGGYAAPARPSSQPPKRPAAPVGREPSVSGPPSGTAPAPGPGGGPERAPAPAPDRREPERPGAERPETGRPASPPPPAPSEDESEVDPVLLAQEFSRLLQESGEGDER
jgi:hypothetical protein